MNTLQQLRDVYSTTFAWESARHANERRHLYGLVYKVCGYINNRCSVLSDEKALLSCLEALDYTSGSIDTIVAVGISYRPLQ